MVRSQLFVIGLNPNVSPLNGRRHVAQIFDLLYRRFPTCGRSGAPGTLSNSATSDAADACRLKIGDTAD
jgi:hypothetical protein